MPLEAYERNGIWWARGRVSLNGRPVSAYIRRSTGASTEAGARDWIREAEEGAIRRHLLGEEAGLTFAEAVLLYPAKPAEARYLMKILPHLETRRVATIKPQEVRDLGPTIYPDAATDTWRRQVVAPISAVINHAHDLGKGPAIRIRGYSAQDRIDQDARRGKESRVEKTPADWNWIDAFTRAADPHNAALAEFMFETGARIGQAVALRPVDLDLQNARVQLPASKGHARQWVAISIEMVVRLANLPPKRPHDRKRNRRLEPRVFGYGTHTGMLGRWREICKAAEIAYLPPHSAGRHGFYTELRVRQGLDPITAARAGRWKDAALPDKIYAHSNLEETEIRAKIRSGRVQGDPNDAGKALKK